MTKVVFIIRESFADAFKEKFDAKLKGKIEVEYVYQELDMLPTGFTLPEAREKPCGTAHAILCAKNFVKEPFCALNADDFYGQEAFQVMANAFVEKGYQVISGGTDNHLMLIDLRSKNITGKLAQEVLGNADITVNKNAVPFDDKSPFVTSGIRVGTAAITTRGFKENDMLQIVN